MGIMSRVGRVFKPLVNFPRWMGAGQLRTNVEDIRKNIQDLKIRRPEVRTETFEEAMVRMHLTEEDIKKRMRFCFIFCLIYAFIALILLGYSIYLIIHLKLGAIISLLITAMMAVFAYRESFWYYQMKTKTLGNTFHNWLSYMLRGGRK